MKKIKGKNAAGKKRLFLYYLDCRMRLLKDAAGSYEARLLMKTHPEFAVGYYDASASKEMIIEDADFVRESLLHKMRVAKREFGYSA